MEAIKEASNLTLIYQEILSRNKNTKHISERDERLREIEKAVKGSNDFVFL